jgi:putative transposase
VNRYEWIAAQKADNYPVAVAAKTAGVSRQAFYEWDAGRDGEPTNAELAEAQLVNVMRGIDAEFDGVYGSPRMTVELANRGYKINHKRVERLMKVHGIVGVHKPAKVRTTIPAEHNPPLPDLIGRRFAAGEPDIAWVSDITYIRTPVGWLYLATVIDLGSRRLLGYSMANHMRTELVADALAMAVAARGGHVHGIIFHSDRGSQYMSRELRDQLAALGMVQSVGRTGVCWDNAVAEAFFGSLKRELVHRYRFGDHAAAGRAVFVWINRYNTRRLHSSLNYQTPTRWENAYRQHQATKAA